VRISKSTHLKRLLQTQDVLISVLAFTLAVDALWLAGFVDGDGLLGHFQLLPFVVLFSAVALQDNTTGLRGQSIVRVAISAIRFAVIVVFGVLALAYIGKLQFVSRYSLGLFAVLLMSGLVANRYLLRWWYFRGRKEKPDNFLKVLVIGTGKRARTLMKAYRDNSEWGIDVIGLLDPQGGEEGTQIEGAPFLGKVDRIEDILKEKVVDEVIVCLPRSLLDNVSEVVEACEEQAVCLKFLADLYEVEGAQVHLENIGTWPVISIDPVARDETKLIAKRLVDLILTIPSMLLVLPLFGVVALAIKLDSRGPVFFVQPRVGLNKRIFPMIKFRSMYEDAEARMCEIEHLNEADGPIFKMKNDPRVTRVGRFIRRTSIDELPQLFNVIMGHMSLIGPRPMSLRDVEKFSLGVQRRRFSVRPGLACLREISGRSRLSFEQWLALDLKYIDEWSIWLDLKILLMLFPAVLRGDGAS